MKSKCFGPYKETHTRTCKLHTQFWCKSYPMRNHKIISPEKDFTVILTKFHTGNEPSHVHGDKRHRELDQEVWASSWECISKLAKSHKLSCFHRELSVDTQQKRASYTAWACKGMRVSGGAVLLQFNRTGRSRRLYGKAAELGRQKGPVQGQLSQTGTWV